MQLLLPADIVALLAPFAPLFSRPVWRHAQTLLVGALLSLGQRTVSAAQCAVGLRHLRTVQVYHRVLNRAVWSSRGASRILLQRLLATFAPAGPLVLGIDETTRAAPRHEARCRRDRSRSGPLEPEPVRQGTRAALELPHGAVPCPLSPVPCPLGEPEVGAALSHGAGPL